MQSRAWARVKQASGWKPFYLMLKDDEGIRAGALVLRRGIPGTGPSLLYAPRGPVLDWMDQDVMNKFAEGLYELARQARAFVVQVDPAISAEETSIHHSLTQMGFRREEKVGLFRIGQPIRAMRIPLDRYEGPEGLLMNLHRKTRYLIRTVMKGSVVAVPRTDREASLIFYQLLAEAGRKKGYPVRGYKYHEAIWKHCVQSGHGEYLFAEWNGVPLAAILVLNFGRMAWYMYGASTDERKDLLAPYLLQWTALTRAWESGCSCYDMRGVYSSDPKPGDAEYGIYAFKRKFNAELVNFLGEYDLVIKPTTYNTWRWMEKAIQGPASFALSVKNKLGKVHEVTQPRSIDSIEI